MEATSTDAGMALPNLSTNLDEAYQGREVPCPLGFYFLTRFFVGLRGRGGGRVSGQSVPDAPQAQERGGLSPRRSLRID